MKVSIGENSYNGKKEEKYSSHEMM